MTRQGIPLREYPLRQKFSSGIEFATDAEYVSEYEAREAARFGGYNYMQWLELEPEERALGVAHYRTHLMLEAHIADAAEKAAAIAERTRAGTRGGRRGG